MGIMSWFRGEGRSAPEPGGIVSGSDGCPTRHELFLRMLKTIRGEEEDAFVTFSLVDDDDRWVQVAQGDERLVNVGYRYGEPPEVVLPACGLELPGDCTVQGWEPESFLTLRLGGGSDEDVATLLDALFDRLLDAAPDEPVRGRAGE